MVSPLRQRLTRIRNQISDAQAVIETAVIVMEGKGTGPEPVAARQGLIMLAAAYNEFDSVIGRLSERSTLRDVRQHGRRRNHR